MFYFRATQLTAGTVGKIRRSAHQFLNPQFRLSLTHCQNRHDPRNLAKDCQCLHRALNEDLVEMRLSRFQHLAAIPVHQIKVTFLVSQILSHVPRSSGRILAPPLQKIGPLISSQQSVQKNLQTLTDVECYESAPVIHLDRALLADTLKPLNEEVGTFLDLHLIF